MLLQQLRRFAHWIGDANTDRTIKNGLAECMRFLVLCAMVGGIIYTGVDSFGTPEARSTMIASAVALGLKWLRG